MVTLCEHIICNILSFKHAAWALWKVRSLKSTSSHFHNFSSDRNSQREPFRPLSHERVSFQQSSPSPPLSPCSSVEKILVPACVAQTETYHTEKQKLHWVVIDHLVLCVIKSCCIAFPFHHCVVLVEHWNAFSIQSQHSQFENLSKKSVAFSFSFNYKNAHFFPSRFHCWRLIHQGFRSTTRS